MSNIAPVVGGVRNESRRSAALVDSFPQQSSVAGIYGEGLRRGGAGEVADSLVEEERGNAVGRARIRSIGGDGIDRRLRCLGVDKGKLESNRIGRNAVAHHAMGLQPIV